MQHASEMDAANLIVLSRFIHTPCRPDNTSRDEDLLGDIYQHLLASSKPNVLSAA